MSSISPITKEKIWNTRDFVEKMAITLTVWRYIGYQRQEYPIKTKDELPNHLIELIHHDRNWCPLCTLFLDLMCEGCPLSEEGYGCLEDNFPKTLHAGYLSVTEHIKHCPSPYHLWERADIIHFQYTQFLPNQLRKIGARMIVRILERFIKKHFDDNDLHTLELYRIKHSTVWVEEAT